MANSDKRPVPLYKKFIDAYDELFHGIYDKAKEKVYSDGQKLWREIKDDEAKVLEKIDEIKLQVKTKQSQNLLAWIKFPRAAAAASTSTSIAVPSNEDDSEILDEIDEGGDISESEMSINSSTTSSEKARSTPMQDQHRQRLVDINEKLNALLIVKTSGLISTEQTKELKTLKDEKEKIQKALRRMESDMKRQRVKRSHMKRAINEIADENPEMATKLRKFNRGSVGRPALETDQPYLHEIILKLASAGGAADDRRRTETIRTCRTLDDLTREIKSKGFELSRSGLYLRLLPKNSATIEGRRHVNAVPVRLIRAQNSAHRKHSDQYFAAATIHYLKELAETLGPQCVFWLSQDDKARVPLGLPAANKQAPILMHLEYRVQLPDHDWVVGEGHKLIPSVYAACVIKDGSLSYSGPTFIAIRSAYHDSSSAFTHAADFEMLQTMPEFADVMCGPTGAVKPILITTVDGGPDENPRFPKVLAAAAYHFKMHNLDALFVATNAPGLSAYNAVERRMAPLSHDLCGLILPHDAYGSHLDDKGKVIDQELAKKNFALAGGTLAEVWSKTVIDSYPVIAQYRQPQDYIPVINHPTEEWKARHIRQSQYCLQIVRCDSRECCGNWRTNLLDIIPNRFLPPPIKFINRSNGILAAALEEENGRFTGLAKRMMLDRLQPMTDFKSFPFDYYCPSICDQLAKRICSKCGLYFPSQAAMKVHGSVHGVAAAAITDADESTRPPRQPPSQIPIYDDLFDFLKTPFENVEDEEVEF